MGLLPSDCRHSTFHGEAGERVPVRVPRRLHMQGYARLMDCIATACSSGKCTCPADQYHQSCLAMEGACLDLEFECSNNRVKCSAHAKHPWDEDKKGLLEALEEMRVKKCKLKEASEAGW